MRAARLILLLALAGCSVERTPAGRGGAESAMADLERARFAAMVAADTTALRPYLASDLTYTHSSGVTQTRAQLLQQIASGQLRYTSITPDELHVRTLGEAAVVTGRARLIVNADTFAIRFTDVWRRAAGRWQLAAWQSTRLS